MEPILHLLLGLRVDGPQPLRLLVEAEGRTLEGPREEDRSSPWRWALPEISTRIRRGSSPAADEVGRFWDRHHVSTVRLRIAVVGVGEGAGAWPRT
jgi:hypothetical protein